MNTEKTPHADQRYIHALLHNDPNLVEEIYHRYAGKIKGMILNNNGQEEDAADIFQEALVDIYRKAAKGDFILTCPFEALLVVICKNKWITQLKKRQKSGVTFKDPEGYNFGSDVFKEAELVQKQNERRNLLEQKLTELGESCREILKLSWLGKPMEEVATLLKMSYAYARKRKSDCMGKLTELVMASPDFKQLQF
jgi:RNA polymerase sigma factor (sigma-70 family)